MRFCDSYHVDEAFVHLDPGTQQEGEEKFVFLKQRATHIAVQTEGEVLVNVHHTLRDIV